MLHNFLCISTRYQSDALSLTAHAASTLKPRYPQQASEYLTGQACSTYSRAVPVILMEGNQKDLTLTDTKKYFSPLAKIVTLI